MKRLALGLLVGTALLAPVLAQAQVSERRIDDIDRDPVARERVRAERREARQERRAERQAERAGAPVADPATARPDRPRRDRDGDGQPDARRERLDGDGMRQARPDRVVERPVGQAFPDRERRREAREERRADRIEDRRDRRDDRVGDRRDWRQGQVEDRRNWREDRRDDRRDWRDDRTAGGYFDRDERRYDRDRADWGRDAYRGGQVWNRGWRNDRRYDYDRYRQTNRGLYRLPRYYAPYGQGYQYRRFGLGTTLSRSLFAPGFWLDDPFRFRLPPAYGPYRWVRYHGDALLVDLRTGRVVDGVYDIFY